MKTAMQELLVLVEQMFSNAKTQEVESAVNDIINIITQEGISKEKEQIMNAHTEGYSNYDSEMTSIDYFNKTYNN